MPHPHIPEIEKVEEYKEKLREEWQRTYMFLALVEAWRAGSISTDYIHDIADWWIDQIFKREDNSKGAKIRIIGGTLEELEGK